MRFHDKINLSGVVEAVMVSNNPKSLVTTRYDYLHFRIDGPDGDNHHGITKPAGVRESNLYHQGTEIRNNRQWSAGSLEELKEIAMNLNVNQIQPEWLGLNLMVAGIPNFSKLPGLTHLLIGPENDFVTLVVYEMNLPCSKPGRVISEQYGDERFLTEFPKKAMGLRGLVGWVEKPGIIKPGMTIRPKFPQSCSIEELESILN